MENSLTVKLGDFKCYPCPCTTVTYVALDREAHPTAVRLAMTVGAAFWWVEDPPYGSTARNDGEVAYIEQRGQQVAHPTSV